MKASNHGIQYIICAAGEGSRLKKYLPHLCKPMIVLHGKTLMERSLDSLNLYEGDQVIIIYQAKDGIEYKLHKQLQERWGWVQFRWIKVDQLTRGQLETALLAKKILDPKKSIVIFNSDTFFRARALDALQNNPDIEGIVPCVTAPGDAWSFCRLEHPDREDSQVLEVAEKKRISSYASVGYYYFRSPLLFVELAEKFISENHGEVFVAPLYNEYIKQGLQVRIAPVESFRPMGTIDQLQDYWGVGEQMLRQQNPRGVLVFDLDGTLTVEDPNVGYDQKKPRQEILNKLIALKKMGYQIIIHTARRMRTHRNDEARVIADIGAETINWLNRHQVPFDGLRFGKPFAESGFYIDDRALLPEDLDRLLQSP